MRLRALVRSRADKVALVVGGLVLLVLSVLALSGSRLAAGMLVFAAGVSAGIGGAGLAIRRSRRKRLVAGLLLPAALISDIVVVLLLSAESGFDMEPTPGTLAHGFFFGVLQPTFGTLTGIEYLSYWDDDPPHDGGSPGAEQTPRLPSSRKEALARELYREPNLFRRLFALPLLAFSVWRSTRASGASWTRGPRRTSWPTRAASYWCLWGRRFSCRTPQNCCPMGSRGRARSCGGRGSRPTCCSWSRS